MEKYEMKKKTNIFQDLWQFVKKWFCVLCSIFLLVCGVVSLAEANDYRASDDIQSAILFCVDGWAQILLSCICLIVDAPFWQLSPAEPDKNKNENKE